MRQTMISDVKIKNGYLSKDALPLKTVPTQEALAFAVAAQRINNIIREHGEVLESIDFKVDMTNLQNQVDQARAAFTKKVNRTIKRKHAEEKKKGKNK